MFNFPKFPSNLCGILNNTRQFPDRDIFAKGQVNPFRCNLISRVSRIIFRLSKEFSSRLKKARAAYKSLAFPRQNASAGVVRLNFSLHVSSGMHTHGVQAPRRIEINSCINTSRGRCQVSPIKPSEKFLIFVASRRVCDE